MPIVSITLPDELLKRFEEFMKERGYYSRSEAFRDALRSLMSMHGGDVPSSSIIAATIMTVCDIQRKDVDMRLTQLRDEYDDVVVENVHRHIERDYCLEVFIAQGSRDRVLDFISKVRGLRDVRHVEAIFLPLYYREKT